MRKILITGGAGFIGSALTEKLLEDSENFIVVVDNLTTGEMIKLPVAPKTKLCFIKCDVNSYMDISSIMQNYHFDFVFHYAAMVGVQRTQQHPVKVLSDIKGIENILLLSKNTGVKRVFFSSSSEVYGEPMELPQNEKTTPLNSRIPYAVVKNAGEAFLRSYKKEYDLDYTIFRFFNTYGPKQSIDFVMSRFIAMALKDQNITIFGDGKQTRTFCYIDDNIDACVNAFYEDKVVNDIMNVGGDIEITILELAEKIIKISGSKSKIIHLPALEEGDMLRRYPDVTKMHAILKRQPYSMEEGIKKILENTQYIIR
ncbi:MAG TPA: NAD-dependent epimerase/dehydratase family protein [Bacteroidales bacterium]|nr:NAD-dependent epimerase/dehydratase family protein [Bacteroidales bacterium]HPS16478.1 NAD-dependent epimerase/dehydratase family protein [Bacteroidales bacterium]